MTEYRVSSRGPSWGGGWGGAAGEVKLERVREAYKMPSSWGRMERGRG